MQDQSNGGRIAIGFVILAMFFGAIWAILRNFEHARQYWVFFADDFASTLRVSFLIASSLVFCLVTGPRPWIKVCLAGSSVAACVAEQFGAPIATYAGVAVWIVVWLWTIFFSRRTKLWRRLLLPATAGTITAALYVAIGVNGYNQIERNVTAGLSCGMSTWKVTRANAWSDPRYIWNAYDAVTFGEGNTVWMNDKQGNPKIRIPNGTLVRIYTDSPDDPDPNTTIFYKVLGFKRLVKACAYSNGTKYTGYMWGTDLASKTSDRVCDRFDCTSLRDATRQDPEICPPDTLFSSGKTLEESARCIDYRNKSVRL
jgi:hypothetical protein